MFPTLKWRRETFVPDLGAGLSVALVSIPEGMAYAIVAGVNPIYGLYTGMLTTVVASLTANTSLLIVTATNALALVTAEHMAGLGKDVDPARALFTLTMLVGVIMFVLGVLRLGSVIRFVSREIMTGFVFATALLVVLGQVKDLVGYTSSLDSGKLVKAIDSMVHISEWNKSDAIIGFASIGVLLLLGLTPLKHWAGLLAILISSLFVYLAGLEQVKIVGDISAVPKGLAALPTPVLPDLDLIRPLFVGAIAAAVVGLAESSGIGATYPNRDGRRSDMSQDFLGQGLGNLAGSFFQSMPAGGSLSRTGINFNGGARTRWSGIYAGIMIAVVLVLFGNYAELIPMSGLAALLIFIGFEIMIREGRELMVSWKISRLNTATAFVTIAVGVMFDLTAAIFTGVAFSLLSYAVVSSTQFTIVRMMRRPDGVWEDHEVPEQLPSNEIAVIEIRGTAYFASVYTFDELLPSLEGTDNSVIILRVRDRSIESFTGLKWLMKYARGLEITGNKLLLADLEERSLAKLESFGAVELLGRENLFLTETRTHGAIEKALAAAEAWIAEPKPETPPEDK